MSYSWNMYHDGPFYVVTTLTGVRIEKLGTFENEDDAWATLHKAMCVSEPILRPFYRVMKQSEAEHE